MVTLSVGWVGVVVGEPDQALLRPEAGEVILFADVVAGVVGGHPIAQRIDFKDQLLGAARLDQQQLALGHQGLQQLKLGIVQLEDFGVQLAVDVGVGEKDLGGAGFVDDVQHVRRRQLHHRLRSQNHRGIFLSPSFFGPDNPVADGVVLEKDPCFVNDKDFERRGVRGLFDLGRCPLQDIEQQRLQDVRVIRPAIEVEGLEARERERVLDVVEEIAELPCLRPAVQALP